jgi:hypothetical protein
VLIHLAPPYTSGGKSQLIDTTGSTSVFSDSALTVGNTFFDPIENISITPLSVSPTEGTQVRVVFGPSSSCTRANPTVSVTPSSQTMAPGLTATYTVSVFNNDSVTCGSTIYTITPTLPTGFVQSPASSTTSSILPKTVQTTTIQVTAPTTSTSGVYTISERATADTGGYTQSASATYTIALPDTTQPTVSIIKPTTTSIPSKGKITFQVNATDNQSVSSISVILDGVVLKTCTGSTSCSISKQVSQITNGSHVLSGKAVDASGNDATIQMNLTK